MNERIITQEVIENFRKYLIEEEKSIATIEKYVHDVNCFHSWTGDEVIDKTVVLTYKSALGEKYAATSVNSMLAALNKFLKFLGWNDCCVKQLKIQQKSYCSEDRELTKTEYMRLISTAENKGNQRLSLMIQTICATGIRVSELEYITVECLKKGEVYVSCKGKERVIFLIPALRKKLLAYVKAKTLVCGPIFITRGGKPVSRCNIWREMKSLCKEAGVPAAKVFPHNLRHLFARVFYAIEKDIAKLADILGHSSINTTRIYIMTTGIEHRRKMEMMKLIL